MDHLMPLLLLAEGAPPAVAPSTMVHWFGLDNWIEAVWLLRLIGAAIALLLSLLVYRLLSRLVQRVCQSRQFLARYEYTGILLLRWAFWPLALLVVLQQAGFQIGNLMSVIAAVLAMVAIGFVAVWSVASNVSGALMIVGNRLFKAGDHVEFTNVIGDRGLVGRVVEQGLMFTTIAELDDGGETGVRVKIPNNYFFQHPVRLHPGVPAPRKPADEADGSDTRAPGGIPVREEEGEAAVLAEKLL